MFFIPVILGSTRKGRQSIKPAQYILRRLRQQSQVETELIDLAEYDLPIMEERLRFLKPVEVPPHLLAFSEKIVRADSIVIVSPEYNNGYPGVLKNALDYLLPEYKRKPIAIVPVSAGGFGGLNCLAQLRLVILGMGARRSRPVCPSPTSATVSTTRGIRRIHPLSTGRRRFSTRCCGSPKRLPHSVQKNRRASRRDPMPGSRFIRR